MHKIEKMLAELCPEGVAYKALREIFNTRNGYTPSKNIKDFWENGSVPWFRMEDIRENGRILDKALQCVSREAVKGELFPENSIIVATSATVGEHALITVKFLANQRFTCMMLKDRYKEKFDIKFLYYYCFKLDEYCLSCLNQGNFSSVDMKKFAKFQFPVPPLAIQRQIVHILDDFTQLTAKLTAELTAELTMRQRQYEYYRNHLLQYPAEKSETKLMEEICYHISSGKNKDKRQEGDYPVYGSTGIIGRSLKYVYDKPQILVARVGANAGFVHVADGKYDVSDNTIIIDLKEGYSLRYFYHLLVNMRLNQYAKGGGQPLVTAGQIKKLSVSVPSLPVQKRTADILDHFEITCSNLETGLSAEIEARKKQYESWRDKLLTFQAM